MNNIQHHMPGVIPDYMLEHLAEHQDSKEIARGTLAAMASLATHRDRADNVPQLLQPVRKRRSVYDAQHQTRLPGRLVMSEHKARGNNVGVNEAYDNTGRFYDFDYVVFGRSSFDGRGGRIISTVNFGVRYCNAQWTGTQMVFGEGDEKIFRPFTHPYDVTCHELGHAIIQYTAGLGYYGQNGALNEHLADVFASMAKQFRYGQTVDQANWTIAEDLFYPDPTIIALRSMSEPGTAYDNPILGKDPQPAHMRDYVETDQDNGGVHYNSGILNNVYYQSSMRLGGHSWETTGQIWQAALEVLSPTADFNEFARVIVDVAHQRFDRNAQEAVVDGFSSVGLSAPPSATARHFALKPPSPALRAPKPAIKKWRRRPAV